MIHKIFSAVLGIAIVALLGMQFMPSYGTAMYERTKWVGEYFAVGSAEQFQIDGDGDVTFGTSGTPISGLRTGSCTIWAGATTVAASSSAIVECQSATNGGIAALTGVTSDSTCFLDTASSTSAVWGGIAVTGVSASSSGTTIVARIANLTGGTFTWSAVSSSTAKWKYTCIDPA